MRHNEQLKDIFIVVVKGESNWVQSFNEPEKKKDAIYIVPLSEGSSALIMGEDENYHVVEPVQKKTYKLPDQYKEVEFKNGSPEPISFLIITKGKK